ncbi:MAG: DNA-processing protein DprA [Polyangiaceae bacterium]|nr:DNA-processing protein DprA [Polyangiaceae bacterium]
MSPRTVSPDCPDYPEGLRSLAPPPALRVRGEVPRGPAIAIVGTRTPSEPARDWTRAAAEALARRGLIVWSGGAVGVDAAAHEGALDAGAPTVVVLGSGLDAPFPPQNRELFERIAARGGGLVAIFDDHEPAARSKFLKRNGVLAAGTDLLLVVECGIQSGARNAAAHARRLRKRVAVAVQPPWSTRGRGCWLELQLRATALRDLDHAFELTSTAYQARTGRAPPAPTGDGGQLSLLADPTTPAERALLEAVGRGDVAVDALCSTLGQPASAVSALVVELVLRGLLERTHRGLRLASRRP